MAGKETGVLEAATPLGTVRYRLSGPAGAPYLILGPSLGTSAAIWKGQAQALAGHFRLVRYEHPGHGGGKAPRGPYSMEMLAREVLALMDALRADTASFCGLSLGGMVAIWIAAHRPERVERLVLAAAAPRLPPPEAWHERAAKVRREGPGELLDELMGRWFTPAMDRARKAREDLRGMLQETDPEGYASCAEAIAASDLWPVVPKITAPTLVVGGAEDPVVAPSVLAEMARAIPGAALAVIPGAAHLVNVERAAAFTEAVMGHLKGVPAARGRRVRAEVLGEEHVRGAESRTDELSAPFQDFITRAVWGDVWTRPGLPRDTRRLLAMALLAALGHTDELAMHVRAALRAGMPKEAISEVLLQVGAYAGVPAANAAFRVALQVLEEEEHGAPGA